MTIELQHPYEQVAEQIMYATGATSIEAVLQGALDRAFSELSDEQRLESLRRMVQAGFDSGEAEGDPLHELIDELRTEMQAQKAA